MVAYRGIVIKDDIYGNKIFYIEDNLWTACTLNHAMLIIDRVTKANKRRKKERLLEKKKKLKCDVIQYYPAYCSGFDEQVNTVRKVDSIFNFPYVKRFANRKDFKEFVIYLNFKEHDQYILMAKVGKEKWGVAWINNGSKVNVEEHPYFKKQ